MADPIAPTTEETQNASYLARVIRACEVAGLTPETCTIEAVNEPSGRGTGYLLTILCSVNVEHATYVSRVSVWTSRAQLDTQSYVLQNVINAAVATRTEAMRRIYTLSQN
jgi:hypothetical protein